MATSTSKSTIVTQPVVKPIKAGEVSPSDVKVNVPPVKVTPLFRPALTPLSTVTEPWTSFGSFDTRIFKDDFCHEKHFTTKVKATTVDGATYKLKETINIEKEGALKVKDEIKLWFPLLNGPQHLHARLTNSEGRLHYDNGITELGGEKVNLYGSFGFARDFKNFNIKAGLATVFKRYNTDNRLMLNENKNVTWYHKTLLKHSGFRFGLIGVLDLTNQLVLKKDLLLGYTYKEWDVIAKAEQAFDKPTKDFSNPAEYFSSLFLTTIYNHSYSQRYALQLEANPVPTGSAVLNATALLEYKYSDKSFTKIAVSTQRTLAVLVKKTINSMWSLSGGALIPLPGSKAVGNKFGLQVDLNI